MRQRGRRVPPASDQPRGKRQNYGAPYVIPAPARQPSGQDEPSEPYLPRVCFYRAFEGEPDPCPRCGRTLIQQYASYLIATGSEGQLADSFTSGSDAGWFCPQCPTIVVNTNVIGKLFGHPLAHWNVGTDFAVLGLVDLDAVPPEKRHLRLGTQDNPFPLVEFSFEP
jgi:hypothetical protein